MITTAVRRTSPSGRSREYPDVFWVGAVLCFSAEDNQVVARVIVGSRCTGSRSGTRVQRAELRPRLAGRAECGSEVDVVRDRVVVGVAGRPGKHRIEADSRRTVGGETIPGTRRGVVRRVVIFDRGHAFGICNHRPHRVPDDQREGLVVFSR